MKTNSLGFPNMFDVARNRVSVISDNASIVNRVRLMILTEPTEEYDNPNFGVGLRRHLWQYNNENQMQIITQRVNEQLELHEPCVDHTKTVVTPGLLYTGDEEGDSGFKNPNRLTMTIGLSTIFNDNVEVPLYNSDGMHIHTVIEGSEE